MNSIDIVKHLNFIMKSSTVNKYSTCGICGTMFVYKKKSTGCMSKKTVYELTFPNCGYDHTKKTSDSKQNKSTHIIT